MNDLVRLHLLESKSALSHFLNMLRTRDLRELHVLVSLLFDDLSLFAGEFEDGVSQTSLFHLKEDE